MRRVGVGVLIGAMACDPNMALVGTPCTPIEEADPSFVGFDQAEVHLEATQAQQQDGDIFCMVNHFRGRTTCPYGQDATGTQLPQVDGAWGGPFPSGVGACKTTSGDAVIGAVQPQCVDRRSTDAVVWTCRCANSEGKSDDRSCSCPSGTTCRNVFADVIVDMAPAAFNCVPIGTLYSPYAYCHAACDPTVTTCP